MERMVSLHVGMKQYLLTQDIREIKNNQKVPIKILQVKNITSSS